MCHQVHCRRWSRDLLFLSKIVTVISFSALKHSFNGHVEMHANVAQLLAASDVS